MALGLFARQIPIGLDVPGWLMLYIVGDDIDWDNVQEIIEGAATIGVEGATVVVTSLASAQEYVSMPWADKIRARIKNWRPWFRIVLCNDKYYSINENELMAGRSIVLRFPNKVADGATNSPAVPVRASIVRDWCVVMDSETTMIGKTSNPAGMLTVVTSDSEAPRPWREAHWTEAVDKETLLAAFRVLALNVLCKPARFRSESFFFANEYLDETVSKAFNERRMRARWQQN
jgi:hypothetical protein